MIEESIRDYLLTSDELSDLLVGGILSFNDSGRNGIGIKDTPDVFENGFLKPCALIKIRSMSAMSSLRDSGESVTAARGYVEIYLYNDGDAGYETITEAQELIYVLLTGKVIAGAGYMRWVNDLPDLHQITLENAAVIRSDYMITKVRG